MSKFNPDFWEVVVERGQLESFTNEDALYPSTTGLGQNASGAPSEPGRCSDR